VLRPFTCVLLAALAGACSRAEPARVTPATTTDASPPLEVTVPAAAQCTLVPVPGFDVAQAEILLDGEPLAKGDSVQLPASLTGRHVLRFHLPGCKSRDVVLVIDPLAQQRTVEVSLEPAMGDDADSPFVYDLY